MLIKCHSNMKNEKYNLKFKINIVQKFLLNFAVIFVKRN